MCVCVTADVIYNFDDLDELTACALIGTAFYLATIRLIVFTIHQKDMLYVVETMRKDWTCSSYEDRAILKEKCLFSFKLSKCFIIMVTATLSTFALIPILEVRIRNHILNISTIYDIQYRSSQDTKFVRRKMREQFLNFKVIFHLYN